MRNPSLPCPRAVAKAGAKWHLEPYVATAAAKSAPPQPTVRVGQPYLRTGAGRDSTRPATHDGARTGRRLPGGTRRADAGGQPAPEPRHVRDHLDGAER